MAEPSKRDARTRPPTWFWLAPFLGSPPALSARQWRVLGLLAAASFFEQYDNGLFSLALKQIQAEFAIADENLGFLSSIIRLGALPSLAILWAADRLGRRRVLLLTIVSYSILTGASGLAPEAGVFIVCQFLARMFIVAESLLVIVIIAEEFDSRFRGWGIGSVIALGLCGRGLAFILFSFIESLPLGWRALYLVGLLPLVVLPHFRRTLSETELFERLMLERPQSHSFWSAWDPLWGLFRMYPLRLIATAVVTFFHGFSNIPVDLFMVKYLQEMHGWRPWHVALLGGIGGALALWGNALAGRVTDLYGRKRLGIVYLCMEPLMAICFFSFYGAMLPVFWITWLFASVGNDVILGSFRAEMFPTSHRSSAGGAAAAVAALGGSLSLVCEGFLYVVLKSHWSAIPILASTGFLMGVVVKVGYPETSQRQLREVSPERW